MEQSIREWYMNRFPNDDLGANIEDITFFYLLKMLIRKEDVYPVLADDSVIRERCFQRLSFLLCVDYRNIYDLWVG